MAILATGLSISAVFKNHGNVNVHFVGLNASAVTIALFGVAHISIDAGAMYLVHQCSMALFSALQSAFGDNEWGSLNSAQFATLIADCEKIKADLDKLNLNCAQLYAARCKRSSTRSLGSAKNPQFGITSLWKKSVYGRTLTDIKSDPDMVEKFAEGMNILIRQILGHSLATGDLAIVTSPKVAIRSATSPC